MPKTQTIAPKYPYISMQDPLADATVASLARAGAAGMAVFCGARVLDRLLRRRGRDHAVAAISQAATGVLSGLLVYDVLRHGTHRRRAWHDQSEVIGQMNHHVRNALEIISLSAHNHDEQMVERIDGAVRRIEWALREVLGPVARSGA